MRSRIVLWGRDGKDEKVLIGLELISAENMVHIHTFPEAQATEIFYNLMMNEWRNGKEVEFPEGHTQVERPLTVADSLLPEDLKVERTDVITRAQTEWHFVVLSSKLYQTYKTELEELKERIDALNEYKGGIWEELKGFWSKVQEQMRDRNLFREHSNHLREETNALFDKMKELRKSFDTQLRSQSEEIAASFHSSLEELEGKIEKGLGLKPLFEDLKKLQNKFKEANLIGRDRNKLRKRIDKAFKIVKDKRFGGSGGSDDSKAGRMQRRYDGLVRAISKMQSSIGRDRKDVEFEERRISTTDGQLEAQIRTAKLKMIKERINSKQEKLDEMLKIEVTLKDQIAKEIERQEQAKAAAKAKEEAKAKIAAEVADNQAKMEADKETLEKAAEKIKASKAKVKSEAKTKKEDQAKQDAPAEDDSLVGAVSTTLGESLEDVVDTIKAIAEVVGDKVEDLVEEVKEDLKGEEE